MLGNVDDVVLCFKIVGKSTSLTGRSMRSIEASIFDPFSISLPYVRPNWEWNTTNDVPGEHRMERRPASGKNAWIGNVDTGSTEP